MLRILEYNETKWYSYIGDYNKFVRQHWRIQNTIKTKGPQKRRYNKYTILYYVNRWKYKTLISGLAIEIRILNRDIFIEFASKLALVGPMPIEDIKKNMSIDFGNGARKRGYDESKSDTAKAKDNSTRG